MKFDKEKKTVTDHIRADLNKKLNLPDSHFFGSISPEKLLAIKQKDTLEATGRLIVDPRKVKEGD